MSKNSLGYNVKRQLKRYINKHLPGLSKSHERFAFDMAFGIAKSGDSKVSNVGRALEEKQDLSSTVKRLYNNLNSYDYTTKIENTILSSHPDFSDDTIIALDYSDITKPYAKKMEFLSRVRDGDKGTIGSGYNQIILTATQLGNENPAILANKLFSKEATPDLKSTDVALDIMKRISEVCGSSGIYTQDRYFDNKRFYKHFVEHDQSFVTRAKQNRKVLKVDNLGHVISGRVPITSLAKACHTPHELNVEFWNNGRWEQKKRVRIGARNILLPCIDKVITLVVIKGFGKIPMMLLTNIDVSPKCLASVINIFDIYRCRWKCEEWIRYVKTEYNLEDIRSLNWQSLNNIVSFVNIVTTFISKRLSLCPRLNITRTKLIYKAKPIFFEKAKMTLYMISSGVKVALKNVAAEFRMLRKKMNDNIQMELAL